MNYELQTKNPFMTRLFKSSELFNPKADLIKKLKQKDLASFEFIFDMYAGSLYTLVESITKNTEKTNELLIKVFASIYKSIEQFEEGKTNLYIWMLGIARTIALESVSAAEDQLLNRGQSLAAFKNINGIEQLINQLPGDCSEILSLNYFSGMTPDAIAKHLRKPIKDVKSCRNKGLRLLAKLISPSGLDMNSVIVKKESGLLM